MPAGTVSRHLSVLRSGELVTAERNGQEMVYAIVNPKIVEICDLMRTVLAEQLRRHAAVAETFDSSSEA
jgi:DNA-binding transcriptional ArsR family regulator